MVEFDKETKFGPFVKATFHHGWVEFSKPFFSRNGRGRKEFFYDEVSAIAELMGGIELIYSDHEEYLIVCMGARKFYPLFVSLCKNARIL